MSAGRERGKGSGKRARKRADKNREMRRTERGGDQAIQGRERARRQEGRDGEEGRKA